MPKTHEEQISSSENTGEELSPTEIRKTKNRSNTTTEREKRRPHSEKSGTKDFKT